MSRAMFSKWRQWLDRIYRDQLHDLLVSQDMFHQFEGVYEAMHRDMHGGRVGPVDDPEPYSHCGNGDSSHGQGATAEDR